MSDELEFFNSLSGNLDIELTVPAERIGNLLNMAAPPEARVKSVKLVPQVYEEDKGDFRDLTPEELDLVAYRNPKIKLRSEEGEAIEHKAPNGRYFTVRELIAAVEETERKTRDQTDWFGGVDVQHVFFEGIHESDDGVFDIYWGS
jgi:hypothetical protein